MFFLLWHIFHGPMIMFFCGTFTLHMEITLQLRFVFVRHCEIFFITSQLRYLFVRYSYAFLWRWNYDVFWYVRITHGNKVTITLPFCSPLWRIFHYIAITLFIYFNVVSFFDYVRITFYFGTYMLRMEITLQLRFVFVCHCEVFLLRPNYIIYLFDVVTLFDYVRIMLCFGMFQLRT